MESQQNNSYDNEQLKAAHAQRIQAMFGAINMLLSARTPEEQRVADLNLAAMRNVRRIFEDEHGQRISELAKNMQSTEDSD